MSNTNTRGTGNQKPKNNVNNQSKSNKGNTGGRGSNNYSRGGSNSTRGGSNSIRGGSNSARGGSNSTRGKKTYNNHDSDSKRTETQAGSDRIERVPKTHFSTPKIVYKRSAKDKNDKKQTTPSIENITIPIEDALSGKIRHLPALADTWAIKTSFLSYLPVDNDLSSLQTEQTLRIINEDISKLLQSSFNVFWSTLIHNKSVVQFLDSFLRYFTSKNEISSRVDEMQPDNNKSGVEKQRRQIFIRVWSVYQRIFELKDEQTGEHMSERFFSETIASTKLLSVPSLIDLCVHYGCYQRKLLLKYIPFAFDVHPPLLKEFRQANSQLQLVLDQCASNLDSIAVSDVSEVSEKSISELSEYLFNIVTSFVTFLDFAPLECIFELKNFKSLLDLFVYIYEQSLCLLEDLLKTEEHKNQVAVTRIGLLKLYAKVLSDCFITPLTKYQAMDDYDEPKHAEEFLFIISHLSTTASFVAKKRSTPPAPLSSPGISILASLELELSLRDAIRAVSTALPTLDNRRINQTLDKIDSVCGKAEANNARASFRVETSHNAPSAPPVTAERLSEIENIKQIFPELGDGYVNACLDLFKDVETTIDRILNADPAIANLDHTLSLPSSAPAAVPEASVYEDVPAARPKPVIVSAHIGKKNQKKACLEDDIEDIKLFNAHYAEFNYNDEYDDSMDQYANFSLLDEETGDEMLEVSSHTPGEDRSYGTPVRTPNDHNGHTSTLTSRPRIAHTGPKSKRGRGQ